MALFVVAVSLLAHCTAYSNRKESRTTASNPATMLSVQRIRCSNGAVRTHLPAWAKKERSFKLRRSLLSTHCGKLPRRIVFGSCSSQREDMKCWKSMQLPKPRDLVILMGDNIYAGDSRSLEDAYGRLNANRDFQKLRQESLVIATMDDNDYTSDLERGKEAFLDTFEDAAGTDERRTPGRGVYAAHTWKGEDTDTEDVQGSTSLQVILLDVRYHATADDWLGDAQWKWLQDQLKEENALRIVVSPIQILPTAHKWDCWNTRPDSRRRLLGMLKARDEECTTTLLLSGDRHVAAMYRDGNRFEVTSSSLTHSVKRPSCLDNEFDPISQISPYTYENNFGELSIKWDKGVVDVCIRSVDTGDKLQTACISF